MISAPIYIRAPGTCKSVMPKTEAPSILRLLELAMAFNSRNSTELLLPKKWNERWENASESTEERVAVIYYLSRNGHLKHPHFIDVPLSSSHGLHLRDVMNRLNFLRGSGMPYMYSWSSKRSYKNGYVWQDLSENDLINPTDGRDYILKGSELSPSGLGLRTHLENLKNESNDIKSSRKKHQSWSSFENSTGYQTEYRVYKCESNRELGRKSVDMATQTEEKKRRSRNLREEYGRETVVLSREELPSPPSMSSSEGMDRVSGIGSGDVHRCRSTVERTTENDCASRKGKASRVLVQLITCASKISQKSKSVSCT